MSTRPGWSDPVCAVPVPIGVGEQIQRTYPQDHNRWLIETKHGLFQSNDSGALQAFVGPSVRSISHVVPLNRDQSLIFAHGNKTALGGAFRADKANLKIQELNGSEALRFNTVGRLPIGGAIVGTDRGLYRVDPSGSQLQEVSAETGRVFLLEQVDDAAWLVGAAAGIFRTDGRASRADRLAGADTGEVTQIHRLADGGWLFAAEKGLFRADPPARNVTLLQWRKPIRVAELQKLTDGSWIARTDQGLLVADPQARRLEAIDDDTTQTWRIHINDERGLLLQNKRLLYVLLPGAKKPEFLSGEPVSDIYQAQGLQDGWLAVTRRGLVRVDLQRRRILSLRGSALGRVASLHPLKTGGWIAATDNGLFRIDQALQGAEPMPGASVGQVLVTRALNDGSLLVGGARGLFRVDPEGQGATPLPLAGQTEVYALEQLSTGSWLAVGRGGLSSVGPKGDVAAPVPGGPMDERDLIIQPLANGRALLGSSRGILSTVAGLADADVTLSARGGIAGLWRQNGTLVEGSLRHACSAVAEHMNLLVEARQAAEDGKLGLVRVAARVTGRNAEAASVSAEIPNLGPGRWNLQLLTSVGGSDVPIGKPSTVSADLTFGRSLQGEWPLMLIALGALQAVAFGGILGLSRWRPGLLRFLRSGWGKGVIWLSFLVPYVPFLQRWALLSWFMTERKKATTAAPALDVVVGGPDGENLKTKELVLRLTTANRLWLQGRSGMGKSTAFAGWQSAFFAECSGLFKATRRFGFALLPIPPHLMLPARLEDPPDAVILGMADAALHDGGSARDPSLVRAMVRTGRLALAFDSPDEVIREAIKAFSRKHPKARLLVASDHSCPAGFEAWQLPSAPSLEMIEELLKLWLGAYSGSRLAAQLDREDMLPHILTYYDVRVVADLVIDDPKQVLPTDRIKLYRALLARAGAREPKLQDLGPLRSLAWELALAGRSEMKADELSWLDRNSCDALLAPGSRLLREVPGGYAFDHDQLRFLLAAEFLVETNRTMFSLVSALETSPVWMCSRGDQEELWRFVAAALAPEDLPALWRFSLENPARVFLQCALHKQGFETKIFPLGIASALASGEKLSAPVRLRAVEA